MAPAILPLPVATLPGPYPLRGRPVLLDLFSGGGGAAHGYTRAGWDCFGVDLFPSPRYPGRTLRADVSTLDIGALAREIGARAIHASPPCQRYSSATREDARADLPDLLLPVADALGMAGLPACIENVPGAPWAWMSAAWSRVTLCGTSWGLPVYRHRVFAFHGAPPPPVPACHHKEAPLTVLRRARTRHGAPVALDDAREALGLPADARLTSSEAGEAIPPVYGHLAGIALLAALALPDEDAPALPPSARARCKCGCGIAVYASAPTGRPPLYASVACRKRAFRALKGSFDARCR